MEPKKEDEVPEMASNQAEGSTATPLPANELDGAFQDLESVVDLRKPEDQATQPVSPSRVRMTETSKLLSTIGMSSALAGGPPATKDREADLKATAMQKMRNRPWYYHGEWLLVAGLMGVAIVGLLTAFVVLLVF